MSLETNWTPPKVDDTASVIKTIVPYVHDQFDPATCRKIEEWINSSEELMDIHDGEEIYRENMQCSCDEHLKASLDQFESLMRRPISGKV